MPRHTADSTIGERIKARRELRGWSVRFAADRAGLSPSSWSRIERGLRSVDNRFVLADIASALDCSVSDLAGHPAAAVDRTIAAADALVPSVFTALVETAPDEPTTRPVKPVEELARTVELIRDLYRRCDHLGIMRVLPDALLDMHAATAGPDARAALGFSVQLHLAAMSALKHMGRPAEAWIAAERGRWAADRLGSPVAQAVADFGRTCAAAGADGYGRSYTLAQRGIEALNGHLDDDGALPALGLLTLRAAFAAGGLHRDNESAEAFAEAGRIAERTGETGSWDMYFGPSNVATWQMSVELDAGDPGRAVEIARGVNPTVFPAATRQSAFHLDVARALARVRSDRASVRSLLLAERLAPQRVRVMPLAHELARHLLQGPEGGRVRGFAERVGIAD